MTETLSPQPAAWLASRIKDTREILTSTWLERLADVLVLATPGAISQRELLGPVPALIEEIAEYVGGTTAGDISANAHVVRTAADLGRLRFAQRATVHQLVCEYEILAEVLEDFLMLEAWHVEPPLRADDASRAIRRLGRAIRVLQRHTIDAFMTGFTEMMARQNAQLIQFSRVVAHEMRQPLGVLQLIPSLLPVREGDMELTHLLAVFDRNVRRIADVAGRLERLSHAQVDSSVIPLEQRVDFNALVPEVVKKLSALAREHDVRVKIGSDLPVVHVNRRCSQAVLTNVIENAMTYADPAKAERIVEVVSEDGHDEPAILVRDNGIGMPPRQVQHLFREFARPHVHRDRRIGGTALGPGLTVVRDYMDACGGTVRFDSTEGAGTTVTLTWPARTKPAAR